MPSPIPTMELLRDVFVLYANFMRELATIEKEHQFNFSELQNVLSAKSEDFFPSLIALDPKVQLAFLATIGKLLSISKEFQNPMALRASDKLSFAEKPDPIISELEIAIGPTKITSSPTDLDKELVERCAHKDYHDTLTNALAVLEDRMRSKLNVGREYFGEKLINLAFNPEKGRLALGETSAGKEGTYLLFKGAFSFFRNPPAHTLSLDEGRNAALKVTCLVDLLIKLVAKARLQY
jgi:hypothetical protein